MNETEEQAAINKRRIPWEFTCTIMDGIDRVNGAEIPLKEAIDFIELYSQFKINLTIDEKPVKHKYAEWILEDGQPAYAMLREEIPIDIRQNLHVSRSFLFLYQMFGRRPLQAGSTMGVQDGIISGGINRPYATVPTDLWWYHNLPEGGFQSRAASILAHEIINTINCVTEVAPWNCAPMVGENSPDPYITEQNRLKAMTNECYAKLRNAEWSADVLGTESTRSRREGD